MGKNKGKVWSELGKNWGIDIDGQSEKNEGWISWAHCPGFLFQMTDSPSPDMTIDGRHTLSTGPGEHKGNVTQGYFCVCGQPMRDDVSA